MSHPDWRWLGHSAVRLDAGGRRVYLNPFLVKPKTCPPGEIVLVGNPRAGFCSPGDVAAVRAAGARVFGPAEVAAEVPGAEVLRPGDAIAIGEVRITATLACNDRFSFFPRERRWLGFLVEAGGRRYWHAGAGDRIPEMAAIRADVAFLPVSGRYVMDEAAATAAAESAGAAERVALFLPGDRFRLLAGFTV